MSFTEKILIMASCFYCRYFHVCDGGLVPDIMHDVLEGALEYEVKLLLKTMICSDRYFTVDEFNRRLVNIELGYMEISDRPTEITLATISSSSNLLKQQGLHMCIECT